MDLEPRRMNELLLAAKPALLALPIKGLQRPRIPRERASELTTVLRREFAPLVPRLPEELAPARIAERKADYEALEPTLRVFYAADLAFETPWTPEQKARRVELVRKVRAHDELLSDWAVPVFKNNEEASGVVEDILRGRGIRDDADDTVRFVALFRQHWSSVEGKTLISEHYLDVAEAEARELLQILDSLDDGAIGSPRDLRQRAYTAWQRSYNEIFYLGRYLLRHDPEAARRFPVISAERAEIEAAEDGQKDGAPAGG